MLHDFLGKKILMITAHPDDESFLAADTLYRNHAQGGETILLCVSFGERGDASLGRSVGENQLRALRKNELEQAARFLGVRKLVALGVPDTKVRLHKKKIFESGLKLVKRHKPDVIVSFGVYGMSGHHDHIAVGEVAKRLARIHAVALYTFTLSARGARMWIKWLENRARLPIYTARNKAIFEKPAIAIRVDQRIKMKALSFHASQLGGKPPFHRLPVALRKERLGFEYFHAANDYRV